MAQPAALEPAAAHLSQLDFWKILEVFRSDPSVGAGIAALLMASRIAYQMVFGKQGGEQFSKDLGAVVNDGRTRAGEVVKVLGVIVIGFAVVAWLALRG